MKRVTGILCVALLVLPFISVCAGDPYDPGRIYDPPRTYHPRGSPTLVGQYVRVNDGMRWEYGTVRSVRGDSLVLAQKSSDGREGLLALSQSKVHDMQVRASGKRHGDQGAAIGGLVGLIGGVALGIGLGQGGSGEYAAFGGLGGACLGAVVGGVIGLAVRTEQWQDVDVDLIAIGVAPRPSGQLALGLTVQF